MLHGQTGFSQPSRSRYGKNLVFFFTLALAVLPCMFCNSPTGPAQPVITVLAPAAGEVFATTDTVAIIGEIDFSKFASGITIELSMDSAKTWDLLKSLPPKTGVAKDTLLWVPSDDFPASALVGKGMLIRIRDYDKKFITNSGYFTFN